MLYICKSGISDERVFAKICIGVHNPHPNDKGDSAVQVCELQMKINKLCEKKKNGCVQKKNLNLGEALLGRKLAIYCCGK